MFGKSFEEKVNDAVGKLASMGIQSPSAQVDGKVVTIRGVAHDPASKAKAIAWFNETVETENTLNMIRVEVPKQAAPVTPVTPDSPTLVPVGPASPAAARADVPSSAQPTERFHVVEKGDTLSAIAKKYYGKASDYPKIFNANKDVLKDPDHIFPGQRLRIP